MKLLEENLRLNLLDSGHGLDFMDMTAKAPATKAKINKWGYTKLESLCTAKESSTKWKGDLRNGRHD